MVSQSSADYIRDKKVTPTDFSIMYHPTGDDASNFVKLLFWGHHMSWLFHAGGQRHRTRDTAETAVGKSE
jgi:hypothetical protein